MTLEQSIFVSLKLVLPPNRLMTFLCIRAFWLGAWAPKKEEPFLITTTAAHFPCQHCPWLSSWIPQEPLALHWSKMPWVSRLSGRLLQGWMQRACAWKRDLASGFFLLFFCSNLVLIGKLIWNLITPADAKFPATLWIVEGTLSWGAVMTRHRGCTVYPCLYCSILITMDSASWLFNSLKNGTHDFMR